MRSGDTKETIGIIVQARLGSSRFPGKILKPFVYNETVLSFLLKRLSKCCSADKIIVATTKNKRDDALASWLKHNNYLFLRGKEENCLDRFYHAARAFKVDIIVRVTSDCPLVLPDTVDKMVGYYCANKKQIDYLSNRQYTNFPEGLDVEIFSQRLLNDAQKEARDPDELEHLNYFFLRRSGTYKIRYYNHSSKKVYPHYKLSIDTPEDLRRVKQLFLRKRLPADFSLKQLLKALSQRA